MHPAVPREGQRTKRAEGVILQNILYVKKNKIEMPPTCLQYESNKSCALASSWEIPIMLRAGDFTESRRHRYDAGVSTYRVEHSIEL